MESALGEGDIFISEMLSVKISKWYFFSSRVATKHFVEITLASLDKGA